MEQLLQVGVITQTHGIRGEVKVFPTTDDPARFERLKIVINGERERKAEKDRIVIDSIHPYLDMEHFNELMDRLTKNEKRLVEKYIEAHWK